MTATMYPTRTHAPRPIVRAGAGVERHANYAARRVVVGLLVVAAVALMVVVAATSVGALLDVGGSPAVASNVATAPVTRLHVAQPGDTMWSIADQFRGDVSHGRYVDALIDVNGGTVIQVGQAIRLP
ncbi:MAG TPA: LysM peptidoglycan-binding domain-containing protein [Ilumatobacteraceae bacterium]|nr:LysM peptidoglycan-binding domain-containing protein [Ilumatobacteraceae bacterium]